MKSHPDKPPPKPRPSDPGPSHQHDDQAESTQRPLDPVDEAEMESFPASDPPALGRDPRTKRASQLNPEDE